MTTSNLGEQNHITAEAETSSTNKLPNCKTGVDDVRAQIAGKQSTAAQGRTPEELKKLYLAGKISMNQLAYEIRVHNSNTADWLMKDSRRNMSQTVDFRAAPEAKVTNPGAAPSNDSEKSNVTSHNASDAKRQARETDDPEKKRQAQKEETRLKQDEAQKQVIQISIYNERQREQKLTHIQREDLRLREEEELDQSLVEGEASDTKSEVISRTKQSMRDQIRRSISKERQEELEKSVEGASKASR